MTLRRILGAASLASISACASLGDRDHGSRSAPEKGDPRSGEVRIESDSDWDAYLVLDNDDVGIWTVDVIDVFAQYGSPEVVGLDDSGKLHAMVSYSGKWTPITTIADGSWLGGLTHGDVDPRVPGSEVYTGSQRGNVYQVVAHKVGVADNRLVATIPGREIHTLVATDLLPERPGTELLAFTRPGGLWLLTPRVAADGFEVELLEELPGRVRDAKVLPDRRAIATVERSGKLSLLTWADGRPQWTTVFERPMGMGRVSVDRRDGATILWNTCDDGTIWRHEENDRGGFDHELVYAGPQGPRGIAVGRFDPDPSVETVVVFGYSADVELLSRRNGRWEVRTIFTDRDRGHWIAKGELDGRNATDEIVLSGYGARIVMLARPPGDGLPGVLAIDGPED